MLAYAANRRAVVDRRPHPNTMLFIIGAHVAVVAAAMSARMDLPRRIFDPPIRVTLVPEPVDPPAHTQQTKQQNQQPAVRDTADHPRQQVVTGQGSHELDTTGEDTGIKLAPIDLPPIQEPTVKLDPVRSGPQLLTSASELKPPYPASKLLNEEEAVLRLKLTIDNRGRVIAVDPVGRTDPAFLEAARRHLIAHWRYRPAMDDGQAVGSSAVITLRFELDG